MCPNHSFSKIKMKMKNKTDTRHCQFFWIITDDTFMTSTPKVMRQIIMCLWILLFSINRSVADFCRWRGWGIIKLFIIGGRHKCMFPKLIQEYYV